MQNLEEKSVNIYAILINLGANTVDDVALTDLKIKDGEIFERTGEKLSKYSCI